jgi:hypothetical protein
VYAGRIEHLAKSSDASGMWVHVSAFGWQRHLSDQLYRGVFRDRRLQKWISRAIGPNNAEPVDPVDQMEVRFEDEDEGDLNNRVKLMIPASSVTIPGNSKVRITYSLPSGWPGVGIRRLRFAWKAAIASATSISLRVFEGGPGGPERYNTNYTTATQEVDLTSWTAGLRTVHIHLFHADTDLSSIAKNIIYISNLFVEATAAGALTANKVIKEVVARLCPKLETSGVKPSIPAVDPLVYESPTAPREILDEMVLFGPTDALNDEPWYWAVLERRGGLWRLVFDEIPAEPSYVVAGAEIRDAARDHDGQFNEALLQYTTPLGVLREVERTQSVPALDAAGLTRTKHLAFDFRSVKGVSDVAALQRVGDRLLREARDPTRTATATVVGDMVRDARSGGSVPFWNIRAGRRIRLLEIKATDIRIPIKDDEGVYLIRRVRKNLTTGQATLELDNRPDELAVILRRASRVTVRGRGRR